MGTREQHHIHYIGMPILLLHSSRTLGRRGSVWGLPHLPAIQPPPAVAAALPPQPCRLRSRPASRHIVYRFLCARSWCTRISRGLLAVLPLGGCTG